ncbi:MAG: ABC transporter permease [Planctomycetota bacterium]
MLNHPLAQLVLARLREFYREPEAVFWVFGFPILMTVGLGVAFRNQPVERFVVDVQQGANAAAIVEALGGDSRFDVRLTDAAMCRVRLRTGKTTLVIRARDSVEPNYEYLFDDTRSESLLARREVDDALQRAAGRVDPVPSSDAKFNEPGARYIDFLVPGLLGMNLMGGGLWGIGFVTVDMRIRKLLKRYLATPMKKTHFLGALMVSRMLFMIPEILVLLVFAHYAFGVVIHGSLSAVFALVVLGAVTFCGIGLLVASRAKTLESVSGWMNLIMLPMWLLSGIFFSSDRFPEAMRPYINMLPLTALNDALRSVMQEGASLASQGHEIAVLAGYSVVTFALALLWFRWS